VAQSTVISVIWSRYLCESKHPNPLCFLCPNSL